MGSFYREFRELVRGPEFLALAVICLLLGVGDLWRLWPAWDDVGCPERLWQIVAVPSLEELLEELQRALSRLR